MLDPRLLVILEKVDCTQGLRYEKLFNEFFTVCITTLIAQFDKLNGTNSASVLAVALDNSIIHTRTTAEAVRLWRVVARNYFDDLVSLKHDITGVKKTQTLIH